MRINKLFLMGLCTVSLLQAENSVSVYGGGIDYTDSVKDAGWFAGAYFQNSSLKNKIELDYERTEISYIDDTLEDIKQNDFTAVWTHFVGKNLLFRVGAHYIDSNDKDTDEAYTAFAGIKYYQGYDFDLGVDGYYSDYTNHERADASKGLTVTQIEPSVGFSFGDYKSETGSFYLKTFYIYISPDTVEGGLLDDSYHSGGVQLKNFNGNWTNELGAWVGKQVFGVRHDGFTIYNLAEERKGGVPFSSQYAFSKKASLKLQYSYEKFDEADNNAIIKDASSNIFALFLNYSF